MPLRVELVAEVAFEQLQSGRFRHGGPFVRWRPDRDAGLLHLRPARGRQSVPFAELFETKAPAQMECSDRYKKRSFHL